MYQEKDNVSNNNNMKTHALFCFFSKYLPKIQQLNNRNGYKISIYYKSMMKFIIFVYIWINIINP